MLALKENNLTTACVIAIFVIVLVIVSFVAVMEWLVPADILVIVHIVTLVCAPIVTVMEF